MSTKHLSVRVKGKPIRADMQVPARIEHRAMQKAGIGSQHING